MADEYCHVEGFPGNVCKFHFMEESSAISRGPAPLFGAVSFQKSGKTFFWVCRDSCKAAEEIS